MNDDTFNDVKIDHLAKRLRIPRYAAVGIVESLFHRCGEYTPWGNVGKFGDDDVWHALSCNGPAGPRYVAALIETGWIARHKVHNLVIVDWPKHAPEWVHHRLHIKRERFLNGEKPLINQHLRKPGTFRSRRRTLEIAAGYVSARVRRAVFTADLFMCVTCGQSDDLTIDHIIPISANGTSARENLQTLCRSCNSRKRDRVGVA